MEPDSIFLLGSLASLGAGLATGAGALPAFFFKSVSRRTLDAMLGWAAGVMLAATSFSLLIPAIDAGDHLWGSKGILAVLAGLVVGALFLDRADKWLPHEHVLLGPEGPASRMRKVWLFIIAVTIHNFPEGMAVGVGYGSGDVGGATALAIGIGIQNMPEGLAVALPLMGEGKSRWFAVIVATLTGLVEPVGGILGAGAVTLFHPVLPFALAFAAGAMLFVISDEIIPETHTGGHARIATFGVIIGFVVMMTLDVLLG